MTTGSEDIEQLKREARALNAAGDWRGLVVVLEELCPLWRGAPRGMLAFFRELEAQNSELKKQSQV